MKQVLFAWIAIALACTGCSSNKSTEVERTKSLILYYSQTGTTKTVAEELLKVLDADIELIEAENPYSGTYEETIARCQQEMESGSLPALKPLQSDIHQYDTIYLGYPVWFGTCARPVLALVEQEYLKARPSFPSVPLEVEDLMQLKIICVRHCRQPRFWMVTVFAQPASAECHRNWIVF